jgi:hypothetical protein
MRCRLLNVAKRQSGIEGASDERMAQAVRRDPLGDPGPPGQPLHRPVGGVAGEPLSGGADEDRPAGTSADVQVKRHGSTGCERDRDVPAAPAYDPLRPVSTIDAEIGDVGAQRFGDPQLVQRQQRDQRVIAWRAEPGFGE